MLSSPVLRIELNEKTPLASVKFFFCGMYGSFCEIDVFSLAVFSICNLKGNWKRLWRRL